jgi:signal peptidase I
MEEIDLETENISVTLVNSLVDYMLSMPKPIAGASRLPPEIDRRSAPIRGPGFQVINAHRTGVLWPSLTSVDDAEYVMEVGMGVSFLYGCLSCLFYCFLSRPIYGGMLLLFYLVGGLGIRIGSHLAIIGLFLFIVQNCVSSSIDVGLTFVSCCLAIAPLFLVGCWRAARLLAANKTSAIELMGFHWQGWARRMQSVPPILMAVLACYPISVNLHTPIVAAYPIYEQGMEPSLHEHETVLYVPSPLMGPIRRGDLAVVSWTKELSLERIVGLPGDKIQVVAGKLLRNGKRVAEPYVRLPYTIALGEFPLALEDVPSFLRLDRQYRWLPTLKSGEPYIVPEDSYFLLNDNRSITSDSRGFGAVYRDFIIGRPVLAYQPDQGPWKSLRIVY